MRNLIEWGAGGDEKLNGVGAPSFLLIFKFVNKQDVLILNKKLAAVFFFIKKYELQKCGT